MAQNIETKVNFSDRLNCVGRVLLHTNIYSYDELLLLNNNLPQMIYDYTNWYISEYSTRPDLLETHTWAPRAFESNLHSYNNKVTTNIHQTIQEFFNETSYENKYGNIQEYLNLVDITIYTQIFATIAYLLYSKEYEPEQYDLNDIVRHFNN